MLDADDLYSRYNPMGSLDREIEVLYSFINISDINRVVGLATFVDLDDGSSQRWIWHTVHT